MTEQALKAMVREALRGRGLSDKQVDNLGEQLLWRIGREGDEGPLTVRVGLASSAPLFAEMSRLRSASEAEILMAVESKAIRVEWVGHPLG
ncbi:MAG: DUF3248 domain-containing protein [Truepera sp.]|nr:DUF3248 domain-containing protein [Truepera sp.]